MQQGGDTEQKHTKKNATSLGELNVQLCFA